MSPRIDLFFEAFTLVFAFALAAATIAAIWGA